MHNGYLSIRIKCMWIIIVHLKVAILRISHTNISKISWNQFFLITYHILRYLYSALTISQGAIYGCLSWVLAEVLPSKLLYCVQYRVILCCNISKTCSCILCMRYFPLHNLLTESNVRIHTKMGGVLRLNVCAGVFCGDDLVCVKCIICVKCMN